MLLFRCCRLEVDPFVGFAPLADCYQNAELSVLHPLQSPCRRLSAHPAPSALLALALLPPALPSSSDRPSVRSSVKCQCTCSCFNRAARVYVCLCVSLFVRLQDYMIVFAGVVRVCFTASSSPPAVWPGPTCPSSWHKLAGQISQTTFPLPWGT